MKRASGGNSSRIRLLFSIHCELPAASVNPRGDLRKMMAVMPVVSLNRLIQSHRSRHQAYEDSMKFSL
ncbi:hypothetical protein [Paenibacillus sonchi]|uniref:hypothetical protein n=1 Tax=Paenibacillus sonchi TaxID=373687 RepID=UPI0002F119D5|nr:hypothetical protein [Paenibacillus sonchi]